jgi:membrane associated rhomboid family serine protease
MNFIKNEIQFAFRQRDNFLPQLIIINVVIWLFTILLFLFTGMDRTSTVYGFWQDIFHLPADFKGFLFKPWTLFSYQFMHDTRGIFHLVGNMLALYWFGRLVTDLVGARKFINLYITAGVFGGVVYLLMYNLVPVYVQNQPILGLIGASGSVFGVAVAAATLAPEYRFNLLLFGPVKIVYIVGVYILMSVLMLTQANAGGGMAHLGGAFFGWFYITSLRRGNDYGKWIYATIEFTRNVFKPKPKMKVSKGGGSKKSGTSSKKGRTKTGVSQEEIDRILDKISQSGYESLTKEEKEKLFSASKND